jgi:hypothetical protein
MRRVPRMKQAKNTTSGVRMKTGSEAIYNSEPRTLEERKITED